MYEKIEKSALNLLAEPFKTIYGFSYACVEDIYKLKPDERQLFLSVFLENFSLVESKKKLSRTEHSMDEEAFSKAFANLGKELEIIYNATISQFPPTLEFASYLLGAMDAYPEPERKALVLAHMIIRDLLPYAPALPKSAPVTIRDLEKHFGAHPKEAAMAKRLAVIESKNRSFDELADILLQILPKKYPARRAILSYFLVLFVDGISARASLALTSSAPEEDGDVPDPDPDPDSDPNKKDLN